MGFWGPERGQEGMVGGALPPKKRGTTHSSSEPHGSALWACIWDPMNKKVSMSCEVCTGVSGCCSCLSAKVL